MLLLIYLIEVEKGANYYLKTTLNIRSFTPTIGIDFSTWGIFLCICQAINEVYVETAEVEIETEKNLQNTSRVLFYTCSINQKFTRGVFYFTSGNIILTSGIAFYTWDRYGLSTSGIFIYTC